MKATRHHSINWVYREKGQWRHFCGDVIEEYSDSKVCQAVDIKLQTWCMLGSNLGLEDCNLIHVILRTYLFTSPSAAAQACERSNVKAVTTIENGL